MALGLVCANQLLYDKPVCNVLGFNGLQEDATWLQQFADDFYESWNGATKDNQVPQWSLVDLTISFISGSTIDYSVSQAFTLGALVGTAAGDSVTTQSALLTSIGHIGGKPNRGRIYFAGLAESAVNGSAVDSGVRSVFRTMVERWRDGVGPLGNQAQLVIVRRPSAVFPTYTFNPVDTITSRLYAATQRRRRLTT